MKNIIHTLSLILLLQFTFGNCKHKIETKEEAQDRPVMVKVDTSNQEYSSMYICPMQCKGSGSDKPGVCPVCGMDYELNESYQHNSLDSTSHK